MQFAANVLHINYPGAPTRRASYSLRADLSMQRTQKSGKQLQVLVRDNNVEQALRVLKKKMQREGVFREMKARRSYEKPSEKRVRAPEPDAPLSLIRSRSLDLGRSNAFMKGRWL